MVERAQDDRRHLPRPPTWAVDVIVAVLVLVAGLAPDPQAGQDQPLGLVARAGSLLVLVVFAPLRRRYPLPALAVAGAFFIVSSFWTSFSAGYLLLLGVCVYQVASTLRQRTALVSSAAMAVTITVAVASGGTLGPHYSRLFGPVAIIAIALAVGQAMQNQRASLAAITERAERAERTRALEARRQVTEERLRIARELHDAAAHQIAAINLHAGVASNALPDRPADAERSLGIIRDSARSVLEEISALLRVLREERDGSDAPEPLATVEGLHALIDDFERSGLRVDLAVRGHYHRLSGAVGVVAYRTVQEGLANALKHGGGPAQVQLDVGTAEAMVTITNPLRTAPVGMDLPTGGHGLLGVRERVDSVQGHMFAAPRDDGYLLQVSLPLEESER